MNSAWPRPANNNPGASFLPRVAIGPLQEYKIFPSKTSLAKRQRVDQIFGMIDQNEPPSPESAPSAPEPNRPHKAPELPPEIGGQKGPEPTRYGDWEKNGRCTDF
jgi:hypothetical protein